MEKQRNILLTTDEFVARAIKVHGVRYGYSCVLYTGRQKPVIIICSQHGRFLQSPARHLRGSGCLYCANNVRATTEQFIEKSRGTHGDWYDYSKSNYVSAHTKITIVCKKHGEFLQSPHEHLRGKGCRACGIENKKWDTGFEWIPYTFPDGRIEKVQGYEPLTIDYLLSSSIEPLQIRVQRTEKPVIPYEWSGSIHKYFPDCYLPSSKTIIETKSVYTWKFQKQQNMAKIQGVLNGGYIMRVVVWNNKHQLVSDTVWK